MRLLRAQGATEYLVLLAVVLIIALVGVALLGFFPGTANDAQIQESLIYWQSANPIAITESAAMVYGPTGPTLTVPYLRVRNTGMYPIRIIKMLGTAGQSISQIGTPTYAIGNISDYFYLAPGEEKYFADTTTGGNQHYSVPQRVYVEFYQTNSCTSFTATLCAASSVCNPVNSSTPGTLVMKDFGFEYVQYVEGQALTKRQIGKPLIIKCS